MNEVASPIHKKTSAKKKNNSLRPSKMHHRFGYNIDSNLKKTHMQIGTYLKKIKKLHICT